MKEKYSPPNKVTYLYQWELSMPTGWVKQIQSKKEPLHTVKIKIYPLRDSSVPNLFVKKKKIWGTQLEEANFGEKHFRRKMFF